MAVCQNQWHHFGIGARPSAVYLVGIGMFTGGTIWLLTHGHISQWKADVRYGYSVPITVPWAELDLDHVISAGQVGVVGGLIQPGGLWA